MIWPFTKKRTSSVPNILTFKGGNAFLEYQCKFGKTEIVPKQGMVAVVLDSQKEFNTALAVTIQSDGSQMVTLKVASKDGGFVVCAQTPTDKGDRLKPDDVVIWVPFNHINIEIDQTDNSEIDPRFGWVGLVVAKVNPVIDINNPEFDIVSHYD